MADGYYKEMLQRLEGLMKEGDWQKAAALINEELSMPYIPAQVEQTLLDRKRVIDGQLRPSQPPKQLTAAEISSGLRSGPDRIGQVLEFLDRSNIRMFEAEIIAYLDDSGSDRMVTALLFDIGCRQQVAGPWPYRDHGHRRLAAPVKLTPLEAEPIIDQAMGIIGQALGDHDPSMTESCRQVLTRQQLSRYPAGWQGVTARQLAYGVIKATCFAYGQDDRWRQLADASGIDEGSIYKAVL